MNRLLRFTTPRRAALAAAVSAAALLAGCASTHGIAPTAQAVQPQQLGLQPAAAAFPASQWWTAFGDPELDRLVQQALADNPNLAVARARLAQAQAATQGARAALLPHVDGGVSSTREQFSQNYIYPPPFGGSWWTDNEARLQANWELDFFGKHRQALDAAIGTAHAAAAQEQAARVLLAANVVAAYVDLARLLALQQVLDETLQQREHIVRLVEDRVKAGLDTTAQQRQAQAEVPQIRLQREQLAVQITQARNRLAALIGAGPQATAQLSPRLDALKGIALPAVIPAELIGRRADVVAARWQAEAALHGVQAAKAAFYPNINLTAFVGLQALGFSHFLSTGSQTLGVGPALTLPIFEGGALRAQLRGKAAEADAAIATYNASVVDAVREAADAIAARQAIGQQIAQQQDALRNASEAQRLVDDRYKAGLTNYLAVLTVQGQVLQLQQAGVNLRAQALVDDVALARALGGGYAGENLPALPGDATSASRN